MYKIYSQNYPNPVGPAKWLTQGCLETLAKMARMKKLKKKKQKICKKVLINSFSMKKVYIFKTEKNGIFY